MVGRGGLGVLHSVFNKLFLLCVLLCAGGARVVVEVFPYTTIWRIVVSLFRSHEVWGQA